MTKFHYCLQVSPLCSEEAEIFSALNNTRRFKTHICYTLVTISAVIEWKDFR